VYLELKASEHTDARSCVVVKHTNSGDVECFGAIVECPSVVSTL
jgi:hypothetical protein